MISSYTTATTTTTTTSTTAAAAAAAATTSTTAATTTAISPTAGLRAPEHLGHWQRKRKSEVQCARTYSKHHEHVALIP